MQSRWNTERDGAMRSASPCRDRGATFVEILVSLVLLGTAGLAVLVALNAAVLGARTHDAVAQNQLLLAEAIDVITDTEPEQVPYVPCAVATDYSGALDPTITVSVLYWNSDPSVEDFTSTCRYSLGDRLQEVRLSTVVDGVPREVVGIKRPVDVPTVNTLPAPSPPAYAGGSGQAVVSPTPGIDGP